MLKYEGVLKGGNVGGETGESVLKDEWPMNSVSTLKNKHMRGMKQKRKVKEEYI